MADSETSDLSFKFKKTKERNGHTLYVFGIAEEENLQLEVKATDDLIQCCFSHLRQWCDVSGTSGAEIILFKDGPVVVSPEGERISLAELLKEQYCCRVDPLRGWRPPDVFGGRRSNVYTFIYSFRESYPALFLWNKASKCLQISV